MSTDTAAASSLLLPPPLARSLLPVASSPWSSRKLCNSRSIISVEGWHGAGEVTTTTVMPSLSSMASSLRADREGACSGRGHLPLVPIASRQARLPIYQAIYYLVGRPGGWRGWRGSWRGGWHSWHC